MVVSLSQLRTEPQDTLSLMEPLKIDIVDIQVLPHNGKFVIITRYAIL